MLSSSDLPFSLTHPNLLFPTLWDLRHVTSTSRCHTPTLEPLKKLHVERCSLCSSLHLAAFLSSRPSRSIVAAHFIRLCQWQEQRWLG